MRNALFALALAAALPIVACRRAPEKPVDATREAVYVELEAAVNASDPGAVLGAWLTQEAGGAWRPDAARLPKMAAAMPRVRADAYAEGGWMSVGFAGLGNGADAWVDGELGLVLEAVAAREDVAGASILLRSDEDGATERVLAAAGHDAAEAAMALVDAWAPELELDYAPDDGSPTDGAPRRSALVAALRNADAVGRRLGGRMERKGTVVVVRFPANVATRDIAATLVEDVLAEALAARSGMPAGTASP